MAGGETFDEEDVAVTSTDQSFQLMDFLLSKLMILGYEHEFCAEQDVAPFPPGYFAVSSGNPGVQFQHFVELAAYLAQTAGRNFNVDQYDDPTSSVNNLMTELRDCGFEADFPASKLRQAYGNAVCRVLNFLSDMALQTRGFEFGKPEFPHEGLADEEEADEEAEVGSEGVADEVGGVGDNGPGEEVLYTEMSGRRGRVGGGGGGEKTDGVEEGAGVDGVVEQAEILKAAVDAKEWRTEVSRAVPRLRARIDASSSRDREWQAHLDEAVDGKATMEATLPDARGALERLGAEVGNVLERVSAKEKFLNTTFSSLADEYRAEHAKVEHTKTRHQTLSNSVSDLSARLAALADSLEEVKTQMDDKGASAQDTSPLVRIKAALSRLRSEMKTMDLRTGVLGHTLMRAKIVRARGAANHTQGKHDEDEEEDFELSEGENEVMSP